MEELDNDRAPRIIRLRRSIGEREREGGTRLVSLLWLEETISAAPLLEEDPERRRRRRRRRIQGDVKMNGKDNKSGDTRQDRLGYASSACSVVTIDC